MGVGDLELFWNDGEFIEGFMVVFDGKIYFSDIGDWIMVYDLLCGIVEILCDLSGCVNGLWSEFSGDLLICEGVNMGGGCWIVRLIMDGKF